MARNGAEGGVKDWGHELQVGLDALSRAEQLTFGAMPPLRRFRKTGRWLIAEDAPRSPALRTVLKASGLSSTARWTLPLMKRLKVQSGADVILLKANLRSFHLQQRVTLKVANPGRRTGPQRLHHEGTVRSALRPSAHARVPKLARPVGPEPDGFLAEELVIGRTPTRADLDATRLAQWLLEFYRANGMAARPIAALCDPVADWSKLRDYAQRTGIVVSAALTDAMAVVTGEAASASAAAAMCNGDLTFSNMIVEDEGVAITDWEYAMVAPVFFDAVRLTAQLPDFAERFLTTYDADAMARSPGLLSPRRQFLVACGMAAQQRIDRVEDFQFAGDRAAYDRRLRGRIGKIVHLMEWLQRRID